MSAITEGGAMLFVSVLISISLLKAPGVALSYLPNHHPVNVDTSQNL